MKKLILITLPIICVFIVGLAVAISFTSHKTAYETEIEKYSSEFDIDSALVFAIAKTESRFDADAVSKVGAIGVMQIMPKTAEWIAYKLNETFNQENLFDPATNIRYGCYYVKYLKDKFDDVWLAVAAYNAGESNVGDWVDEFGKLDESKITFPETKNYVKKVKDSYNVYKKR